MKYLVRAIKYFAYLAIFLFLIIFLLSVFGVVGSSLDDIFRDGLQSVWKILGIMAVFALIYPRLGFGTRNALVPGAYEEIRSGVVDVMHDRGYVLEDENGERTVEFGDDVDFVVIESDDDGNVEIREGDWEVDGDSDDEWEEYDDWDEEEF